MKRATVGPLPSITQDINCWVQGQIAHQPSIYVLDIPGVLVPSIPNIETELKLALAGSVKYLQPKRRKPPFDSDMFYIEDIMKLFCCAYCMKGSFMARDKKGECKLEMWANARQTDRVNEL
nr:short integuments 2, mitochondrial [Quercus suber]